MNRLHRIALPLAALGAAAALFVAAADHPTPAPRPAPETTSPPGATAADALGSAAASARPDVVVESRYALRYARAVALGAAEQRLALDGTWTVLPLGPDRLQVRLDLDHFAADTPTPAGLEQPFQLGVGPDGLLTGAGFAREVPPATRNLLVEMATAFAFTPGSGAGWQAEETDLNGRYVARYARAGEAIERVRETYVTLHTDRGSRPADGTLSTGGRTTFRLDAHGPVEVRVDEQTTRSYPRVDLSAVAEIEGRLTRAAAHARPTPRMERLPLRPIAPLADPEGLRAADRNRIGDADLKTVAGWLDLLEGTDLEGIERDRLAGGVHARLRAFARLHPEALPELLDMLRAAAPERAAELASALGAAGTPEATAALTTLLADPLPTSVTRAVHHALNMTTSPSGDSARALLAEVDDPETGHSALLAAANQARTLDGDDPEATRDVVELLLERYTEATDNQTRGLLIASMGNTGDPRVLPALQHALQTGDASLGRYAAYALRHIPGGEVDGMLEVLLRSHAFEAVRIQAMRAVEVRGPAGWAERIEAWLPEFAAMPHLQAAARKVLARWIGPEPALAMAAQASAGAP